MSQDELDELFGEEIEEEILSPIINEEMEADDEVMEEASTLNYDVSEPEEPAVEYDEVFLPSVQKPSTQGQIVKTNND